MSSHPVTFRARSSEAIAKGTASATRVGAIRIAQLRDDAAADFDVFESMRDQARAIRFHVLNNLDHYLGRFADRVEMNGGRVYWAADAAEAVDHVLRIAATNGVRLVAKSKSMVTEEIGLNDGFEDAGIDVVETDLGEFILQLADERPSHIIAPVLHKTRFDIGKLFEARLGVPYTDDPQELNQIAREHLRNIFLTADMGVSGVNFGVASTGTLTTVTNEGNARLITTAPRIHVAVMGMERLVPDPASLGVLVEVLARSGTGQKLSVYTNMMTGPRRPGDDDGPEQLHVVIVDNGRSRTLGTPEAEILACIRCGACLNICPVYRYAGGHAYGPVYGGPVGAVVTPALSNYTDGADLPFASTLCGACRDVCPVRIDFPELLIHQRAEATGRGLAPPWLRRSMRAYAQLATRPWAWRAALRGGGVLGKVAGRTGWIGSVPSHGSGWTDHRDLPAPAPRSFHDWWKENRDGA